MKRASWYWQILWVLAAFACAAAQTTRPAQTPPPQAPNPQQPANPQPVAPKAPTTPAPNAPSATEPQPPSIPMPSETTDTKAKPAAAAPTTPTETQPAAAPDPNKPVQPVQPIQPINDVVPGTEKVPTAAQSSPAELITPAASLESIALTPFQGPNSQARTAAGAGGGGGGRENRSLRSSFSFSQAYSATTSKTDFTDGDPTAYVSGSFFYDYTGRRSAFHVSYTGGSSLIEVDNSAQPQYQYHTLALTQGFGGRKWSFNLGDQVTYTPESSFGFSHFNGLANISNGPLDLTGATDQSIITAAGARISEGTFAQLQYNLGRRDSLSGGAMYSMLVPVTGTLIETYGLQVQGGYKHQFGQRQSVGVDYSWMSPWYSVNDPGMQSRSVQGNYSLQLTRKLGISLGAGPQFVTFGNPRPGTPDHFTTVGGGASAVYTMRKEGAVTIGYHRGVGSGSGVLQGTESDNWTASYSRNLWAQWHAGMAFAYAINRSLAQTVATSSGSTFESTTGGLQIGRTFGRLSWGLSYNILRASGSGVAGCNIALCGRDSLAHTLSMSLGWNPQPLRIF